jgi:hypothetical protein
MADDQTDYASTLEKVGEGHWRRTYKKDGLTADLEWRFHHLWMDLTDFQFVQGMSMEVVGASALADKDSYAESELATAKGHLDNASLHFIQKIDDEPWRINTLDVTLRFERAWNDPPIKKWKPAGEGLNEMFKLVESDEAWTIGESQMGSIWHNENRAGLPEFNELVALSLRVPRDFLPKVREVAAHPERAGRIRLGVWAKLFEEGAQGAFASPWDHLDFMLEPEGHAPAYAANLLFYSAKALPTPRAQEDDDSDDLDPRPLALKAADAPAPAQVTTYGQEIVKALTYCAIALGAIALILLFKR